MSTLRELNELLRLKRISSDGMVLLVTKGPRPIQTHKWFKVADAVPKGNESLKFSAIVFVQPFNTDEANSLGTWLDKIGRKGRVIRLADSVRDVAAIIMWHLTGLSGIVEKSEPATGKTTDRVTIEELLRVNSGQTRLKAPSPPPKSARNLEPELSIEVLKSASASFDATHPMWLVQKGIIKRFCRVYADRTWKKALTEGKKLCVRAANYGIRGLPKSFAAALRVIREEDASGNKHQDWGDLLVLVLCHINRERTSDRAESRKIANICLDGRYTIGSVYSAIHNLMRLGLIPRAKLIGCINEWLLSHVNVERESNAAEARRLKPIAKDEGKPWPVASLRVELGKMTTRGQIPPPKKIPGWARRSIAKRDARIHELETELAKLKDDQSKS